MRSLLLAGVAVVALGAAPAFAQIVTIGPPGAYGGWYGGGWGYGHSFGYGPAYGYSPGYYDAGPLVRPGYAWGPTYQTGSGRAAYIESPVGRRYLGGPKNPWSW